MECSQIYPNSKYVPLCFINWFEVLEIVLIILFITIGIIFKAPVPSSDKGRRRFGSSIGYLFKID